jgi:antitoxin component HigA of HigAB toxin-antitoxin module
MTDTQTKELEAATAKVFESAEKMAFGEITTDEEYKKALKRVGELMDAKEGTADGAELNALADRIVAYEGKNHE